MTEQNSLELGKGNKLVYIIDMDEPDASFERNKLAKMDDMAYFIWYVQNDLIPNSMELTTAEQVFNKLSEYLELRGLRADELTF